MKKCIDCHIHYEALEVLDSEELEQFERGCTEVRFAAGDKVIPGGMPVTHVVYLKEGIVKVCLKGRGDHDLILKVLAPGSFVGLHDVFAHTIRYCSAIALTPVTACHISHEVFTMLIRSNGDFAMEILKYVSLEEIDYFHRFLNMLEKQVTGRVAEMILYFADHIFHADRFTLAITQTELGTMVGASRESVSRVIRGLRRDRILRWEQHTIEILNRELLEKISRAG
jgi:CRP-like cAMP-binding protein